MFSVVWFRVILNLTRTHRDTECMCLLLLASLIRLFPLPCGLEEVWGRRMTHFAKILELVLNRKHLDCGEMQWVGVCGCVRERERGRGRSPAKDINPIPISWSLNTAGKTWGHAVLAQINPRHIKKKKKRCSHIYRQVHVSWPWEKNQFNFHQMCSSVVVVNWNDLLLLHRTTKRVEQE